MIMLLTPRMPSIRLYSSKMQRHQIGGVLLALASTVLLYVPLSLMLHH